MESRTKQHPIFNNPQHVRLPGADLYQGDCLAVIPGLAGFFDAVVTDPPYSSGGQSKGNRAATTGVAALSQGKEFVGIEVCEHYFQVAVDRLRCLTSAG